MMLKAIKVRLYPNETQQKQINVTIGCVRFLYNQMLAERKEVYEQLKNNKEALKSYKYKTEKQYKVDFPFLKEANARALQQGTRDLDTSYRNFFDRFKKGLKKDELGFPKFKKKHKDTWSYREPQTGKFIEVSGDKLKTIKLGWIKFKGSLIIGRIRNVTITKTRSNKYYASILVETESIRKPRIDNQVNGVDLGLKDFAIVSNGDFYVPIKTRILEVEKKIEHLQRLKARKENGHKKLTDIQKKSKRREKLRIKIATLQEYIVNLKDHFAWHLANDICKRSKLLVIENLKVKNMMKNRKLARSIQRTGWSNFKQKLFWTATKYGTEIQEVSTWFPSSKTCSCCGHKKETLTLSERTFVCEKCNFTIDRDLNASYNLRNIGLKSLSAEFVEYSRGEDVKPVKVIFDLKGNFLRNDESDF